MAPFGYWVLGFPGRPGRRRACQARSSNKAVRGPSRVVGPQQPQVAGAFCERAAVGGGPDQPGIH
eukprot:10076555-Lingulodinium_polyedra.AAC.1